jgi:GNAT superfamily N-acetyltransferase
MRIRNANLSDLPLLVRLYSDTTNVTKLVSTYIKRNILAGYIFVLLDDQSEIKGMYIYSISRLLNPYETSRSNKTFCWLDQISVWPSEQGKGYSRLLLEHYLQIKCIENRLVCILDMEAYYNKFGFIREQIIEHAGRFQLIMTKSNK